MRGQLMAGDLIISLSLFALAVGVLATGFDSATRPKPLTVADSTAWAISDGIVSGAGTSVPGSGYCFQYANGTGNCGGFACSGGVAVSRRLAGCTGAFDYCLLEVRTCR